MVGPKGREGSNPPASAMYRRDAGILLILNLSTPGVVPALGEMAERFNASVQKTAGRESGLGVRIPLSPHAVRRIVLCFMRMPGNTGTEG